MKETITGRDVLVISTLCTGFGVLLAWGLFYRWGSAPAAKPFDAPAWVQAVGSIGAILIAIAVPAIQHRLAVQREADDSLNRARSLSLFIRPSIENFHDKLDEVWRSENPDDPFRLDELADRNQGTLYSSTTIALQIPDELLRNVAELHELGRAAPGILRAIHCVQAANRLTGWTQEFAEKIILDREMFYDHLWNATAGIQESLKAIDEFFPKRNRQ